MHTAENKITVFQNTLESLQKAPNLYCRSKIEFRERGHIPVLRSPSGLQTKRFPGLRSTFLPRGRTRSKLGETAGNQRKPDLPKSCTYRGRSLQMSDMNQCPPCSFHRLSYFKLISNFSPLFWVSVQLHFKKEGKSKCPSPRAFKASMLSLTSI